MVCEALKADRARLFGDHAEDSHAGRVRSDRLGEGRIQAHMDEIDEPALAPDDTEGAVLRIGEVRRRPHNPAERSPEFKARRN